MGVRIAIVSTPRSGNTWLRSLLIDVYAVPELAIHNPADLDWSTLPQECVLQIHWHRTAAFLRLLEEAGFHVVTLMRHHLDVLLSILQFCQHDRSTLRWLDGEGGNERPIYGAMPGSVAFAEYACSARAAALLSVSLEWWKAGEVHRLRYEDLVADAEKELERLTQAIGEAPRRRPAEVVARTTLPSLRARFQAEGHFWQGRPGLWRTLLTAAAAERIAQAHRGALDFGYACDPDPNLTPAQADRNWVNLVGSQVADKLYTLTRTSQRLTDAQGTVRHLQAQTVDLERTLQHIHQQKAGLEQTLQHSQGELNSARGELQNLHQEFQKVSAELDHFHQLGPLPLRIAWKLRNLSHHYPAVSKGTKYVLSLGHRLVRLGKALL